MGLQEGAEKSVVVLGSAWRKLARGIYNASCPDAYAIAEVRKGNVSDPWGVAMERKPAIEIGRINRAVVDEEAPGQRRPERDFWGGARRRRVYNQRGNSVPVLPRSETSLAARSLEIQAEPAHFATTTCTPCSHSDPSSPSDCLCASLPSLSEGNALSSLPSPSPAVELVGMDGL